MMLQRLQLQPSTLNSLLAVLQCLLLLLPVVSASCKDHVKKYCGNMGCQQRLMTKKLDMHESCERLRYGITDECDEHCQLAITEFLNAYNGSEGLFTCNCTDTHFFYDKQACELDRERLFSCPPLVALFQTVDQSSPCITASQDCEGDVACKARLDAYLQSCNPEQLDLESTSCSRECMGALDALSAEPLASNFWRCSCEDTPQEWCRTSPLEYHELCQDHNANLSTSGSPEVPYKPLTTKPTSPPTKAGQNQGSTNDSKDKNPGNSAPGINIQTIHQIGLIASILGVLYFI